MDPARVLLECGQSLPFLPPDFPMGACGERTTADPRVWGPEAWKMLHVFAQNYPMDPSQQAIEACANFINALPFMLPSALAGYTMGAVRRGIVGHIQLYHRTLTPSDPSIHPPSHTSPHPPNTVHHRQQRARRDLRPRLLRQLHL